MSDGHAAGDRATPLTRWAADHDRSRGAGYDERWQALADTGADVHGEAGFCARLVPPGARVLDAGCGTGRVAIRLAGLGYDCTGVDADPDMLDHARRSGAPVRWVLADLAGPGVPAGPFDLVLAAGNVVALLGEGTEPAVLAALARRGGVVVTGFGLDADHLPLPAAPFGLAEFDRWCAAAGLVLRERYATWDRAPWDGGGYVVSVHVTAGGAADFPAPAGR